MPIPQRKKDEDKQKFVSRCMGDETMKKDFPSTQQRIAICLGQTRQKGKSNLIEEVHDELFAKNCSWDDEWNEFVWEIETGEVYDEDGRSLGSEYKGRKVTLNKPFRTPEGPKKFGVYVKNDKGNVVLVRFGDPNLSIKRDDPKRRKSFRARHGCDKNPGPKWKAKYWSCYQWRANAPVQD
jgi:hypothetical protein